MDMDGAGKKDGSGDKLGSRRWGKLGRGLTVSVVLHALLLLLILVGLPMSLPEPSAEETVAVELVPPPPEEEEPAPEPAAPEQPAPPQEPPPEEPPPAEEPQTEEPPPEEAKAEEAKPEEAPAEEPPPPAAQPPEAAAAAPTQGPSLGVLRPVVQFAEEDAGPRKAPDGDAAQETGVPEAQPDPAPQPETPPAETREEPVDETALPGVEVLSARPGDVASGEDAAPPPVETPVEEEADQAPVPGKPLPEVAELLSNDGRQAEVATTAMRGLPRGVRADQLCLTELREQLINAASAYVPELLPSHRLGDGTKFEIRQTAFRARGQWYDLSFRCEIDADATRVVSFAFEVGEAVPKSEWSRRGFPEM